MLAERVGPESIRQNTTFKDFCELAAHPTGKRKHLYLLGTRHALKFFRGRRSMTSVLSRNHELRDSFFDRFVAQQRAEVA